MVQQTQRVVLVEMASCVSLVHLLTTSLATGNRWYDETKAADETFGFLSTTQFFIALSAAWMVLPSKTRASVLTALGLYRMSPPWISFMIEAVAIKMSSDKEHNSLMAK
ncbi:hypothetical protein OGATHE_003421 [Ogataea polymorpha]|uniref:Uncharacterized protein n=1 Tax=Ogataea polymorpha TaxID=460523 RepID=A0A9P8T3D7_9ASCO|nr:hypothetical protein OGATHE_003421 [Ogataea polymorpha]